MVQRREYNRLRKGEKIPNTLKILHVRVPSELHHSLMRASQVLGITASTIIVRYLKYVNEKMKKHDAWDKEARVKITEEDLVHEGSIYDEKFDDERFLEGRA